MVNDLPQEPAEKLEDRPSARERGRRDRAEPPLASQAPPPVFRAPVLRGVPGAADCRLPHGSSLADGTRRPAAAGAGSGEQGRRPAVQDKRQTLHLVSGRSTAAARRGRVGGAAGAPGCCGSGPGIRTRDRDPDPDPDPARTWLRSTRGRAAVQRARGSRSDFAAGSGDSTCAPAMLLFTWLCEALGASPSVPS